MGNVSNPGRLGMAGSLRTLQDLPQPAGGWPLLGHLAQLDPKALHTVLERWCAECGPCFRFGMGPQQVLVTADPEHAQAALRDRPAGFRRLGAIEPVLRDMGIDGVFSVEGEGWLAQRKLVMQALAPVQLAHYFPAIQTITARLLRRWRAAARSGQPVDMVVDLTRYTVDLTSSLSFGRDVNTLEADGDAIQQHLAMVFPAINRRINSPVPYWRWFKLPADRALERALAAIHAFVDDLIDQARAELARQPGEPPANLLQAMLVARDEHGAALSSARVRANVMTLLLAGEDTTAHALAWTFFQLADRPALQDTLAAEAARALQGADVVPDRAALEALPLCEGVVFESLRQRPVVPIIFLETLQERLIGDVRVPAGTPVFLLTRPAALDAAHFQEQHALLPSRWHAAPGTHAADKRAFLQFGAGPRVCPGRHLAAVEMRMVVSTAMRHFRLAHARDPGAVAERFGFTMAPDAVPLRLTPR